MVAVSEILLMKDKLTQLAPLSHVAPIRITAKTMNFFRNYIEVLNALFHKVNILKSKSVFAFQGEGKSDDMVQ